MGLDEIKQLSSLNYLSLEERTLADNFLRDGYIIFDMEKSDIFKALRKTIYEWALEILSNESSGNPGFAAGNPPGEDDFFNHTHEYIDSSSLNDFRIKLISRIAANNDAIRPAFYELGKQHLNAVVGNELMMQRNVNLSVQLPGDVGSILPIHSDVWDGNSPFEVVFWVPLTQCYRTRSMFLLPRTKNEDYVRKNAHRFKKITAEEVFSENESEFVWLDVKPGQGVIFSHTILHGNKVNNENGARWTFNIRFKSVLSPYGDKEAGESFLPITIRPVTRVGYEYREPDV